MQKSKFRIEIEFVSLFDYPISGMRYWFFHKWNDFGYSKGFRFLGINFELCYKE